MVRVSEKTTLATYILDVHMHTYDFHRFAGAAKTRSSVGGGAVLHLRQERCRTPTLVITT